MSGKSGNVLSDVVYSAIGDESLRISRASNNSESFSAAIKSLIPVRSGRGYQLEK